MPLACLAKISPLDPATGIRVDIRVSNVNDAVNGRKVNGLDGQVWVPAMVEAPRLTMRLWNGDFIEAARPGGGSLVINMAAVRQLWPDADTYAWAGAPVTVHAEEAGTAWPWAARHVGNVSGFSRDRGQDLALDTTVDERPFGVPVLTASYAGTTGAEGGADLKNRLKPLAIGWCQNVEPVLIDTVENVYQFSAYGAIEAVTNLYERGSDFGASVGDYASYAALVAAAIPAGRWATCLAAGMVRLGAPAYGVITGDIKGHRVGGTTPRLTGAIISALATVAGISGGLIESAALSAMDSDKPYNANIFITDGSAFLDVARGLALGVNWQSGISLTGKFFVAKPALTGTEVVVFEAMGRRLPQVVESREENVSPPYFKTTLGANRSWRVHTADEISFTAPLVPLGLYDPATTYREGNIVSLPDGSTWLYTYATPTSGNAPPAWPTTGNTWWEYVTPPLSAADLKYADGTPIEDLKPAEAGATAGAPAGTEVAGVPAEDLVMGALGVPTIDITVPAFSIFAYENGMVPADGFDEAHGQLRVFAGGVDVTAAATLSAGTTDCTGTINTATNTPVSGKPKGYYEATAMSADRATLTLTVVYNGYTRTVDIPITKIMAGFEIATSLPTTDLFVDRKVSYDGRLWVNKTGLADGWVPMVDVSNVGFGANMLSGVIPGSNPNRYLYLVNSDGVPYAASGTGPFLSPAFGTGFPSGWSLLDNSTFGLNQTDTSTGAAGYSDVYLSHVTGVGGEMTTLWAVVPDTFYEFSVYTGAHRCAVSVHLLWFDVAGAFISSVNGTSNSGESVGGTALSDYKRLYVRGKSPATAAYAQAMIRKGHTASGPDSWLFAALPMLGETAENPVALLPWNMPGHSIFNAEIIAAHTIVGDHVAFATLTGGHMALNTLDAINVKTHTLDANVIKLNGVDLANLNAAQFSQQGSASGGSWSSPATPGAWDYSPATVYLNCQQGGYFHVELTTMVSGYLGDGHLEIQIVDVTGGNVVIASRNISVISDGASFNGFYLRIRNTQNTAKQFQCRIAGQTGSTSGDTIGGYGTTLSFGWGAFS